MSAVSLLAEALDAGVTLRLAAGNPKVGGSPSPDLLARLRQHKPELIELLSGNRCKFCGGHIDWREPGGRAFADGMAAHGPCWHEAEVDRLLAAGHRAVDPHLAEDEAEVGLHERPLP